MTTLSERIKEHAVKLNDGLSMLLKIYDEREPPITVKQNLITIRAVLKGCLKKIDDFFGVEEL
ncbi:hypothetical protein [Archaeoglobus profundus]|uniref:Uncharacterized protein n=1 Tax=Archaeoglobus profundus (strain DSM 5631 / JCM 9629 / NBRC 100127 / Av18) TaxID=572546 RepID=D2RI45_ARCPA|nr:hypothetical protein [Archaeoglobus profundus]ADB57970.1 hypothetical protein Arcpr_0909 [Archaeoglobus profundus DSM 5631]